MIPQGLGVLPLVPIVIAGLVLLAAAYVTTIAITTSSINKSLDATRQELALISSGQATPQQILALQQAQADAFAAQGAAGAGDPLGLSNALKAATPLLLILAAVLVLPPILRAVTQAQED